MKFSKRFHIRRTVLLFILLFEAVFIFVSMNSSDIMPITEIFAASDYQAQRGVQESEAILRSLIKSIKTDGHIFTENVLFAGDYDIDIGQTTEDGINSAKKLLNSEFPLTLNGNMIFAQGNHDPENTEGLAAGGEHDAENFGVFVINEADYMWFNSDRERIEKTAENLRRYLSLKIKEDYRKPIFIVSHLPLHYSMRTQRDGDAKYADILFNVINDAAKSGLNIIFLFGHNHSNGWDDYLGGSCVYLSAGDSIAISQSGTEIKTEILNFTYMNPGYTGYYQKTSDESETALTATVFTIYKNRVEINRYDKNGKHNLKSKGVRGSADNDEKAIDPDTKTAKSPQKLQLND